MKKGLPVFANRRIVSIVCEVKKSVV